MLETLADKPEREIRRYEISLNIVHKKGLASDLAQALHCKKEIAFKGVYERIVEVVPRSR